MSGILGPESIFTLCVSLEMESLESIRKRSLSLPLLTKLPLAARDKDANLSRRKQ